MVLYCDATNVQGQVATLGLTTPTTDKCVMATTHNGNPGHKNPLTREKAKMPHVNTSHSGRHAGRHTQAMYIAVSGSKSCVPVLPQAREHQRSFPMPTCTYLTSRNIEE